MELKQLRSFVAVVECSSFTKAAEKLHITQPTISTHVHMLEEELHTLLLVRTTKSLRTTPRGWELYECATKMLKLRDELVRDWSGESKKIIHLGASTIPSAYILPELLPAYGRACPDIYFSIHQSDSQGVVDGLLAGDFDVGMVGMECGDEVLTCIPFCRDRMVLITPVEERFLELQAGGRFPLERLPEEPLILREDGSGSQKRVDGFLRGVGVREADLNVTARLNDQEAIKNLVAQGLGISFISERAARNFCAEKRLLMFELPENAGQRSLYLAFRRRYTLKQYVRRFVEYATRFYEDA